MKIVLGSDSKSKIDILKEFLPEAQIVSIKVDSGITEQPLSIEITIKGSINRAKNAAELCNFDYDYAIGMEAGLDMINGIYNLVCVVSSLNINDEINTTQSDYLQLPIEVSEKVKNGEEFGVAIREYQNNDDEDLIKELISRHKTFLQALRFQNRF